jgi:hypothetical protein
MTQSDEEQGGDEEIFERFVVRAERDIRKLEDAKGRGDEVGATQALDKLRRHADYARDWWLRVAVYYPPERRRLSWPVPPTDLVAAVKHYLKIINRELEQDSLQGAGAAVQKIRELIAFEMGSDATDD